MSAAEWIALLADGDSFRPFDTELMDADPLGFVDERPYRERIEEARRQTGVSESIVTGTARIGGRHAVLIIFDFRFFGGSIGVVAGEKIVRALTVATDRHRPVVMMVSSSGARMQEGLPALFQMARTSAAVTQVRRVGVPFVAVLADPATGAPFASCANLADVLIAERGALLGFAGPRVVAAVLGKPAEGLRAEELLGSGVVDAVLPRGELRGALARVLRLLSRDAAESKQGDDVELPAPSLTSDRWALVETIRQPTWPTGTRWLNALAERHFEFRGDRAGSDDPTLVCVAAEIDKKPWIVLAQNRLAGDGLITPGGYRKALRVLRIASRLRLPVLSLIDTPGAQVGPEADRGDVAYWIAECFAALLELPIPVIALVVGQGSSGGALALSVADRIYMLENSMFSVISPEAAAAILADDSREPSELSDALKLTAADAFTLKLIDGVVPGSNPARRARAAQVRRVRRLLRNEVARLEQLQPEELLARRRQRYLDLTRHLILPHESQPELDPAGPVGLQ